MGHVDAVIVGGGAIGLSIARQLSLRKKLVVMVIEKHSTCGMGISSRSSEVFHSGIYYPYNSHKLRMCVDGRLKLLQYLKERRIAHEECGKLIVASRDEVLRLESIYHNGVKNGLTHLELWSGREVTLSQQSIYCHKAIFSPYTGIFDSNAVIQNLEYDILTAGSMIVKKCFFNWAEMRHCNSRINQKEFFIETSLGPISAPILINAGGLAATSVASKIVNMPKNKIPYLYIAKGNYFSLSKSFESLNHLIYPLPQVGGLGIHATIDLGGNIRFGPDVQWISNSDVSSDLYDIDDEESNFKFTANDLEAASFDYSVDETRLPKFLSEIQKYWPQVCENGATLHPAYCGFRPKLTGPNDKIPADFFIQSETHHGLKGLINLYGIESPGWTSSMSLADFITDLV